MEEKIFSISEYISILNENLKKFTAKIVGEIGKIDIYPSGHVYFSLRDQNDQSTINCIVWKSKYKLFGIEMKEGDKIIATGCPNIYKQTGRISFIADTVEFMGEGVLKKEYEKLKEKLGKEGLFDQDKKKDIPKYPQKIGIITSKQGAVMADFLNNLGRFGFKIKMIDSRVEGQAAISDLLASVKTMKKQDIEVLVIMRGGGSFESLQSFNNELLVKEIAKFPLPVIAAIGHDKDIPLVALAADRSVSTPSIAAIILSESWQKTALFLEKEKNIIINSFKKSLTNTNFLINESINLIDKVKNSIFEKHRQAKIIFKNYFEKIKSGIYGNRVELNNLSKKSLSGFNYLLTKTKEQLNYSEKVIYLHNPETRLNLGYSIVRQNNKLIKSVKNIKIKEELNVQFADGTAVSEVKKINKKI